MDNPNMILLYTKSGEELWVRPDRIESVRVSRGSVSIHMMSGHIHIVTEDALLAIQLWQEGKTE